MDISRFENLGKAIIRMESKSVIKELGVEFHLAKLTYGERTLIIADRVKAAVKERENKTTILGHMMSMEANGIDNYASRKLQAMYHPSYLADVRAKAEERVHQWYTRSPIDRLGWLTHKYIPSTVNHHKAMAKGAWESVSEGLEMGEEARLKLVEQDHDFELDYDWGMKDEHLIKVRDHYFTQYRYWKCLARAMTYAQGQVKAGHPMDALGFVYLINQADLDYGTLRLIGAEQDRHTLTDAFDPDDPATITDNGEGGLWWWYDLSVRR